MIAPPHHAAKAAASWYAEALTAIASVGADRAVANTLVCMPGITEKPNAPIRKTRTAATI